MDYTVCDNKPVKIVYTRPRNALKKHGVHAGTLFFLGDEMSNGRLFGIAHVFKRGCGDAPFAVRGFIEDHRIVLQGRAPVRNKRCIVIRERNERLIFDLIQD